MFRMLKMVFFVVIGGYLGFHLSQMNMRAQCGDANGHWNGVLCLEKEPTQ